MRLARKLTFDPFAFVPALLIAVFTVVSYAYQTEDSLAPLVRSPQTIAISLAAFAARGSWIPGARPPLSLF